MNIEFDAYKVKLNDVQPALEDLGGSLNIEAARHELERLTAMQEAPGFWDNPEKSQQVVMKAKTTENKIKRYEGMLSLWEDLMTNVPRPDSVLFRSECRHHRLCPRLYGSHPVG